MDGLAVAGFIITLLSFAFGVYWGWRARVYQRSAEVFQEEAKVFQIEVTEQRAEVERMRSLRSRLDWTDIETAARETAQWLRTNGHSVDVVLAPGARGAIFGQCLVNHLPDEVKPPIVVGITREKSAQTERVFTKSVVITNSEWCVALPAHIRDLARSSILIIDDFARSGRFINKLRKNLIDAGCAAESITSVVVVAMRQAVEAERVDYAWYHNRDEDFYFPWGRAV